MADWAELAAELAKQKEYHNWYKDPNRVRYKLIEIDHLSTEDRDLVQDWITLQQRSLRQAVEIAFGIPFAVGCVGFLGIWASRWVWAGFIGAK